VLPALAPRHYSITCDASAHPTTAHVAFSVVKYATTHGTARVGVATGWLDRILTQSKVDGARVTVPVFLKGGGSFKPPVPLATATMILVGPGTGVAPFRGFLQVSSFTRRPPSPYDLGFQQRRWREAERRHPTGRERLATLHTPSMNLSCAGALGLFLGALGLG
jgi:hypothetical protein